MEKSAQPPTGPENFHLARLGQHIENMVVPRELTTAPYLAREHEAVQAAHEAGMADAASDPFDIYSHDPRLPHQHTIVSIVQKLLFPLGVRARLILAAHDSGALSPSRPQPQRARGWRARMSQALRAVSTRTLLLMTAAALAEVWVGHKMAELLVGSGDVLSWGFGLITAIALTFGALSIAHAVDKQFPGVVRGYGIVLAGIVGLIMVSFLIWYAIGLGGGATADPTGGPPIQGGGSATGNAGTETAGPDIMLAGTYLGLLLFLLAGVVLSHLNDLANERTVLTDRRLADQDAALNPEQQTRLAIELLEACLTLNQQVKGCCRGLIQAYVGGARTVLSPPLSSLWDSSELEQFTIEDPAWVSEVQHEIERLHQLLAGPPTSSAEAA
jgi:hypothetical protein